MYYSERRVRRHRMMRRAVIKYNIKNVVATLKNAIPEALSVFGVLVMVFVLFPFIVNIFG